MKVSMLAPELARYVERQLQAIFPDGRSLATDVLARGTQEALERVEHCFAPIVVKPYRAEGAINFDHLYSDQYLVFLWFLSSCIWSKTTDRIIANKIYLLNKALHGFDCSFDTSLPDVFIALHGVGTVLGKATYSDYLVVYQGCTVGQAHGRYPVLGRGVGLGAGATVLGHTVLGDYVSIGAGCTVTNMSVDGNSSVFRDDSGKLIVAPTRTQPIAADYFSAAALSRQ